MYKVRFFVYLLAFRNGETRMVDLLGDAYKVGYQKSVEAVLDLIFKFGQNDFQPQMLPSVSVGDVIDYFGSFYIVENFGFRKMTTNEFAAYTKMSREERWAVQYQMVKWDGETYKKVADRPTA